jgi:hypothetical protein
MRAGAGSVPFFVVCDRQGGRGPALEMLAGKRSTIKDPFSFQSVQEALRRAA